MIIDTRRRYPEVEVVYATATKPTKVKLKKVFAAYGTPEQLESDNGPPFNSKDFADFCIGRGIQAPSNQSHHYILALMEKERIFMKLLNKIEQRARLDNKSAKIVIKNYWRVIALHLIQPQALQHMRQWWIAKSEQNWTMQTGNRGQNFSKTKRGTKETKDTKWK